MSRLRSFVRYACLSLLPALLAFGQFESGTVLGTINDPSGAAVANANVTLKNTKTGVDVETKTDGSGNYTFVNARLGNYKVHVEAPGFQSVDTDGFDLNINARQRIDLALQVGSSTQSVTVNDAAALLETDNSSRGQVINPTQIVNLPLNGRAYADLILLVPGSARSPLSNQSASSRDASFNVNGQRSELNNFLLDGIDNNAYGTSNQGFSNQVIQPNPDALAEFKVETDNYSAEYGRATGAVVNATIKSGSNQIHGAAWEFLRNTDLNAVGYFKPSNGQKPRFNQNQFGGALGGPIVKNKVFLFGDYEGFRRPYHPVQTATIPTINLRNGNFGIPVRNPLTNITYNGIVPASAISPFAQTVLSQLPSPTNGNSTNNYVSNPAETINSDKGDIRGDAYFTDHLSAFVRYSQGDIRIFSPAAIPGPSGGNANGDVFIRNKQLVPGFTWTVNPTSVLEVRVGLDYTEGGKNPIGLGISASQYNIPNLPTNPAFAGGLYSLNFSGSLSQLGRQSSNPQYQYPLVLDPKVNFSKILSHHSLKVGFEYQLIDTQVQDFHPKYGSDNYTGFFSNPNYPNNNGLTTAQQQVYSLADFMFGARSHYEQNNYAVAHLRQRMYFGYLQDDYKASEKLTLNLGVRYEFATPQWDRDNKLANFDPVNARLIQASSGSLYNRALVNPKHNNWAPRIGLAYKLGSRTVLRSAYGISYVQFNRMGGENLLVYNGPNVVNAFIDQVPTQATCTSVDSLPGTCFRPTNLGFPNNFASPSNFNTATSQLRYIPADIRTGYVQSWHATLQHDLGHDLLLDLAYVGNHSVGLMVLADANQAAPNVLGQNLLVNPRRPYKNFTTIEEAFAGGFGSYHALQFKVEKKYSTGLYFINSFTWSKAIDNAPGHLENYNGDNSRINIANPGLERGLSSYNQPFNNTTSILYDLPFGRGRRFNIGNKALDLVAGGWGVNIISTLTSGLPINVGYGPTTQGQVSPLLTPRPNLTGQDLLLPEDQRTGARWLNVNAFSIPSYTQPFGNAGRNLVKGPFFQQVDLGVHKNFALWSEASHIEFRAEAFNLTNKTNFSAYSGFNTTYAPGSSSFGVFTQAFPARQLQLALKLVF